MCRSEAAHPSQCCIWSCRASALRLLKASHHVCCASAGPCVRLCERAGTVIAIKHRVRRLPAVVRCIRSVTFAGTKLTLLSHLHSSVACIWHCRLLSVRFHASCTCYLGWKVIPMPCQRGCRAATLIVPETQRVAMHGDAHSIRMAMTRCGLGYANHAWQYAYRTQTVCIAEGSAPQL
jgi:hypothetical protein